MVLTSDAVLTIVRHYALPLGTHDALLFCIGSACLLGTSLLNIALLVRHFTAYTAYYWFALDGNVCGVHNRVVVNTNPVVCKYHLTLFVCFVYVIARFPFIYIFCFFRFLVLLLQG
jgi:hypothetical protein